MIRFRSLSGWGADQTFQFEKKEITLGRSSTCDLRIDDPGCSRNHARIVHAESGYSIHDTQSSNGVRVNGKKVSQAPLRYGDHFSIGETRFAFLSEVVCDEVAPDTLDQDDSATIEDTVDLRQIEKSLTKDLTDAVELAGDFGATVPPRSPQVQQHLRVVHRLGSILNSTLEKGKILEAISDSVLKTFEDAHCLAILLADVRNASVVEEVKRRDRIKSENSTVSRSVLKMVRRDLVGVLSRDALSDDRFRSSRSLRLRQVRSFMCVPLVSNGEFLGAIYVENSRKPQAFSKQDLELLSLMCNQAALAVSNAMVHEKSQLAFYETVRGLGNALEAKDKYTRGHSERVARYSLGIGKQLGLGFDDLQTLHAAAELHDIGKIAIGEKILGKNGRLTDEEFATIKKHPELGVEILTPISFLKPVLPLVLHHHERYDGSGYPSGLTGDDIPLGARIINLADAFDAMTTKRPYNQPVTVIAAIAKCMGESGVSFDEACVDAFIQHLEQVSVQDAASTMTLSVGDLQDCP